MTTNEGGITSLKLSRRDFLRISAMLGVSTAIPGVLGACTPAASEPAELLMGFDDNPFWQAQAAAFAEQTGINVTIETIPFMQIHDKYLTSFMAGGGEYDLVPVRDDNVAEWGPKGWLKPLDSLITDEIKAQHFDGAFDYLTSGGSIYGVPRYVFLWQFYYNTELFEKAGLSGPPTTWADLQEYALAMTNGDEYGFITSYGTAYSAVSVFTIRLRAEGGDFLPGGKPAFNTPEGIAALKDLVALGESGGLDPNSFATGTEVNTMDLFLQGKVGMTLGIPFTMSQANNPDMSKVVGKVGVGLMPGSVVKSASLSELAGIGMTATSENDEPSWEYIKYVTSAEEQKKMALANGLIPTNLETLADADLAEQHPAVAVAGEQMKYPMGQAIVVPQAYEIYTAAGNELVAALRGEKDVEAALADAEAATLAILEG